MLETLGHFFSQLHRPPYKKQLISFRSERQPAGDLQLSCAVQIVAGNRGRHESRIRHDASVRVSGADTRTGGGEVILRGVHREEVRVIEEIKCLSVEREPGQFAQTEFAADTEIDVFEPRSSK